MLRCGGSSTWAHATDLGQTFMFDLSVSGGVLDIFRNNHFFAKQAQFRISPPRRMKIAHLRPTTRAIHCEPCFAKQHTDRQSCNFLPDPQATFDDATWWRWSVSASPPLAEAAHLFPSELIDKVAIQIDGRFHDRRFLVREWIQQVPAAERWQAEQRQQSER